MEHSDREAGGREYSDREAVGNQLSRTNTAATNERVASKLMVHYSVISAPQVCLYVNLNELI